MTNLFVTLRSRTSYTIHLSTAFTLGIALSFLSYTASGLTQTSTSRARLLRSEIEAPEGQHASAEKLGTLWLQLGKEYQNDFEFSQAETAYTRALALLHSPATQAEYADSLEGIGTIYFETGRHSEAVQCLRKALAIQQILGDRRRILALHETLAIVMVYEHRFREGEAESAQAIEGLQSAAKADPSELTAALVTHSYALCFLRRCLSAMTDAAHAMELAVQVFPDESLEVAAIWLVRGFDAWKSGLPAEADQAMREALVRLRGRPYRPHLLAVKSQLVALRQYGAFLKATHRKPEARKIEAEIAGLESGERQNGRSDDCNGCTIQVEALVSGR